METSSSSANPNNHIGYGIISAKNAIEFPNLEKVNNSYVLHKTIFEERVDPQSVKLFYSYSDMVIPEVGMNKDNIYNYSISFPLMIDGQSVKFYITFSDSSSNIYRYPETGEYKFSYGSDIISYNLDLKPPAANYEVSDFFPNPFIPANHKTVGLYYKSIGNEIFKIAIIDGAGQKVIETSSITLTGQNYFEWNGYSERGYLCASGVYYALIQLGGKEYGKKLILLK